MNSKEGYNGWTNYETWAVRLWIDGEEPSYRYWCGRAQEIYDEAEADKYFTKEENAINDLADSLKEEHEESMPVPESGVYADLLSAALGEVNWHEIAESMIEEVDKEEGEEEPEEEEE